MKFSYKLNVFNKFLLSYFFIFLIPFLILGFMMYYYAVVKLQGEIEASNLSKLSQVNDLLEVQFKGLENIAARISFDTRLSPFMVKQDGYFSREAINELGKYKDNIPIADELFLYFHQDDNIYSSTGMSSLQTFSEWEYVIQGMHYVQFKDELNKITQPTFRSAKNTIVNGSEPKRILTYFVPIPVNEIYFHGTVVFLIDESKLTGLMNNILGDWSGSIYILDKNKEILASKNRGSFISESDLPKLSDLKNGISTIRLNKDIISVTKIQSNQLKWEYYTLLPKKQFLSRMFEARLLVIFLMLLLVLGGIVAAILLSLKHYRPIRLLDQHIRVLWNFKSNDLFNNEWDRINETIDQAILSHTDLVQRMGKLNPYVRDQVLIRLIKGDFKNENEIAQIIPLEDLGMTGKYFYVMLVSTKSSYEKMGSHRNKENTYRILSDLRFADARGYGVEMIDDGAIAIVMNINESNTSLREVQKVLANQSIQQLTECLQIIPVIGIGTIYEDLLQINRSFIEASAAIEQKLMSKQGQPIFFDDIHTLQEISVWYPLEEQARLIQSIKQGNEDVALETLSSILRIIGNKEQSFLFTKYMCFDVVNSLLKTISELGLNERFSFQLKGILEFATLFELEEHLKHLIHDLCVIIIERKDRRQVTLKDSILQFIQSEFSSHELSLEMVSEHRGLSISYLSRFIKEQTGQTFTDYVGQLRMEKIKRELIHTDKPIKEIIINNGYLDVSNFTRKFRQIEGVTPGQFRKMHLPQ